MSDLNAIVEPLAVTERDLLAHYRTPGDCCISCMEELWTRGEMYMPHVDVDGVEVTVCCVHAKPLREALNAE